jgi:hypothetical protein
MPMPGFTAEVSAYKTNNSYRLGAGGSLSGYGEASVIPQGCGWVEGITCGVVIAGGVVVCTASCLASPALGGIPCYLCWAGYLGALYGFCHDCIPAWMRALVDQGSSGGGSGGGGGGGGSSHPPCPTGQKCCGSLVKMGGHLVCDGDCVPRKEACP